MTIALGLVLIGAVLIYGGITGRSIPHLFLGDNSVPSTPPTPVERSSGTVATGGGTTVTGTVVSPNTGYAGNIHELFYDPLNLAFDEGSWIPAIGGHSDHVHVSFAQPQSGLQIIQYAKSLGLNVTENPYVGTVHDVHTHKGSGSFHYKNFPGQYNGKTLGMAVDVSGSPQLMAKFALWVKGTFTQQITTHK